MKKPEVDFIKGLCPAIAIEQKVVSGSARSTVGSMTEIYDLLRVLYARIGKTISPVSGKVVKKQNISDVVEYIQASNEGSRIMLLSPLNLHYHDRPLGQELEILVQKGYSRILLEGELLYIEDWKVQLSKKELEEHISKWHEKVFVLIDRIVIKKDDEENIKRISDSVGTAFAESEGACLVNIIDGEKRMFSNRFELDGINFPEPSPQLFNYNNPYGACKSCEGYGMVLGIDEGKVIPDDSLSLYEGAIACWNGEKSSIWLDQLIQGAKATGIFIHKAYKDLSAENKSKVWEGTPHFGGIYDYFDAVESKSYKIQNRILLARYRGRTICRRCKGMRLRKETSYIKINGKHIGELIDMPIKKLLEFFDSVKLDKWEPQVVERLLYEIQSRLRIMNKIGLGYLCINRTANSLSGGVTQRINLTRLLGSNLSDSLYILDEPSIGLHPKDTHALVQVLHDLRNLGNTVIVVEHEAQVVSQADHIVDIGPGAGLYGGEILFNGSMKTFLKQASTLTAQYLRQEKTVSGFNHNRLLNNRISLNGASHNNLKQIDVSFPLHALTVVTGVSGSGKSSLIEGILYPMMRKRLGLSFKKQPGRNDGLAGDVQLVSQVEYVSQKPIGRSSRSNPVTYIKAFDQIRQLFIKQHIAKVRGYKAKHFSFNVDGGRCDNCKGEGLVTIEMQFLADIKLQCEVCKGRRFKDEVLEVKFRNKTISDVLEMSVAEAIDFFYDIKPISTALQPLMDVGLDYVHLGQPSSTLSGGEAQRLKLAFYLSHEKYNEHILFMFDEPTTGLHFHDINKLLKALDMLIERGHSVIVIEHNPDFIRNADWVIDLGPGGGDEGGDLVFQGTLQNLLKDEHSETAKYLVKGN
jgi:excinuclease ABC subunit A